MRMGCPHCAEPVDTRDRFCEECGARVANQLRDRVEVDIGVAAGISDRGRRHHRNEDALALRDLDLGDLDLGDLDLGSLDRAAVAVVCDGMSSADRPDEASETAAEVAAEALVAALLADHGPVTATRNAIHAAGQAVARLAGSETTTRDAPACTLVSAVLTGGAVTVGWVGDSRAYWIPRVRTESAPPTRLTEDDSWLAGVLAAGTLTPAEAAADRRAHAITAWLGRDATPLDPHVITFTPEGPGVVIVCTDGLWNYLDHVDAIAAAIPAQALEAPLDAARRLVEIALNSGGHDNITVAVLPFVTPPFGTP
ncbi:MAG: protein phosphatase 2C domain-containing protein [Pseudonocardiaceae bacterium]